MGEPQVIWLHREGNYLIPIYMVSKVSLFIPQLCFLKQKNKQTNTHPLSKSDCFKLFFTECCPRLGDEIE